MPIPGPRSQSRPDPGYRNPGLELPDRINHWNRPGPVWWPGRSPGHMIVTLRGCIQAAGQIRQLWRQSVNLIPASPAYSWTSSAPAPGRGIGSPGGIDITRALRYMTRSVYEGAGVDNSRFEGMHTPVHNFNMYKNVTIGTGQKRYAPTVRNRLTSFGSRVSALNRQADSAQGQDVG